MLWPFKAVIGTRETLVFPSDVIRPYSTEQRINLSRKARRVLSHEYRLLPNEIDRAYELIEQNFPGAFEVPEWQEAQRVTVGAGDSVITADTTIGQFVAGGTAVLWRDSASYEVFTIDSLTGSSITVDGTISAAWSNVRLMPLSVAYAPEGMNAQIDPSKVYSANIDWEGYDNADLSADPGYTTYQGSPLINDGCEVGSGNVNGRIIRNVDTVDNGISVPVYDTRQSSAIRSHGLVWVAETQAELFALRKLFYYLRGRVRSFWMPTRIPMTIAANASAGAATIQVRGIGTTSGDLFIRKTDGTYFGIRYSGATGTTTQTLTLSGTLPYSITTGDYICKMLKMRLAVTQVEIAYLGDNKSRIATPAIEIPL